MNKKNVKLLSLLVVISMLWSACIAPSLTEGTRIGTNEPTAAPLVGTSTVSMTPSPVQKATVTETVPPTSTVTPVDASKPPQNASIGTSWTDPKSGIEFVFVPAGEFLMGSNDSDKDPINDEKPEHTNETTAYWIGKTEITNGQFRQFMDGKGYDMQSYWTEAGWKWRNGNNSTKPDCWDNTDLNGESQPVTCISWYEAMAFAAWLKSETGLEVRLPSEAEWEKAARGTDGLIYPWGNKFDGSEFNFCDSNCVYDWKDKNFNDGFAKTAPVGSYPANASPYGALDMAGNVAEWTSTLWHLYQENDGLGDIESINTEGDRVFRGGAWDSYPSSGRAAHRANESKAYQNVHTGFRLVVVAFSGG